MSCDALATAGLLCSLPLSLLTCRPLIAQPAIQGARLNVGRVLTVWSRGTLSQTICTHPLRPCRGRPIQRYPSVR